MTWAAVVWFEATPRNAGYSVAIACRMSSFAARGRAAAREQTHDRADDEHDDELARTGS